MTYRVHPPFKRATLCAVLKNVNPIVARIISVPDDLELCDLRKVFRSLLSWTSDPEFIFRLHPKEFNSFQRCPLANYVIFTCVNRRSACNHMRPNRWVQQYASEIEKQLRGNWKSSIAESWRIDETSVKVKGTGRYLYRAEDILGQTIDFYLSPTHTIMPAKRFLGTAPNLMKASVLP